MFGLNQRLGVKRNPPSRAARVCQQGYLAKQGSDFAHQLVHGVLRRHTTLQDLKVSMLETLLKAGILRQLEPSPSRPAHPRFGRSAALQMLAIPAGIAALCALQPIPNRGAPTRGDLFSVALVSCPVNTCTK